MINGEEDYFNKNYIYILEDRLDKVLYTVIKISDSDSKIIFNCFEGSYCIIKKTYNIRKIMYLLVFTSKIMDLQSIISDGEKNIIKTSVGSIMDCLKMSNEILYYGA